LHLSKKTYGIKKKRKHSSVLILENKFLRTVFGKFIQLAALLLPESVNSLIINVFFRCW